MLPLLQYSENVQKLIDGDFAVVVEGKKDALALQKLGVDKGRIFVLNAKPLFFVAEEVASAYSQAAILTDLDREGRKLYSKLNTLLQQLGVEVDNTFRNFLFKSTKLRQIEGIKNLIQP